MEYPGSTLTRPWRRLLWGVFVAAFFIISPIIVVYTMGYKYDWKYGFLRETGNLSIDILPRHANSYLDGLKIGSNSILGTLNLNQTMPIRLKNISPHSYDLRISAPGYYDWQKEIEVTNRQTVYIKEIEMMKKNKPEQIVKGKFSSLSLSPTKRYLLYTTPNGKQTKIILRDIQTGSQVIVLTLPSVETIEIRWAEKNNYAVLYQDQLPQKKIYILNAEKPETTFVFSAPNDEVITAARWRQNDEPELYYTTPTKLLAYRPKLNQQTTLADNTFVDWYIDNDELWTIETNTTTKETKIFKDALGFKSDFATLAGSSARWQIQYARNNHLLLRSDNPAGYRLVRGDKQFFILADDFLFSPYNNWWLAWSASEVWAYSEGDEPRLLNRFADKIETINSLDRYNTLAISRATKTSALYPYYSVQHDLLPTAANSIATDPAGHQLYYIDKNGLWRLTY